jgi:hypothetical protein
LSQFYVPGDEIYIFGFSRGAYTARSLAGFVAASGLLKKEFCDATNLATAWSYYRTPPKKRLPAKKANLERLCSPDVRIKFLGVFDTVGAMGVPSGMFRWIGARWTQFHDTKLGSAIEYAFHAVSIDEKRGPYKPALWAEPDHANNKAVEQVWFPGAHSDIGGGFSDGETQDEDSVTRAVLFWMISRLKAHTKLAIGWPEPPLRPKIARPHDGYFGWFPLDRRKPMFRLIKETPLEMTLKRAKRYRDYKLAHPDRPYREYLHVSALDVLIEQLQHGYWPWNLLSWLKSHEKNPLPVVNYDGEPLSSDEVQSRCKRIIAELG